MDADRPRREPKDSAKLAAAKADVVAVQQARAQQVIAKSKASRATASGAPAATSVPSPASEAGARTAAARLDYYRRQHQAAVQANEDARAKLEEMSDDLSKFQEEEAKQREDLEALSLANTALEEQLVGARAKLADAVAEAQEYKLDLSARDQEIVLLRQGRDRTETTSPATSQARCLGDGVRLRPDELLLT